MSATRLLGSAVVVIVFGAVAGGAWWWYMDHREPRSQELSLYGNVEIREVELAFEVRGRIDRIEVEEGTAVEKGQRLAALETDRFQYALDQAEARIEVQRQVVAELEAGTRPQNIRKAQAEVKAVEARLAEAESNYERLSALEPRGAASEQALDDARAARATASAELRLAQAALDLAKAGPREQQIAAAQARQRQFEAEKALAQWNLDEAKLYAPNAGIIRQRILEPGDMAFPERPVFTLALNDPLWIRAYVSEPQLGRFRPGMTAHVATDSYPDKRYEGWVGFISPTAEFTPKTVHTEELRTRLVYEVRVYVRNPQGELRLGMPVTVFIPLDVHDEVTGENRQDGSQEDSNGPDGGPTPTEGPSV